MNVKDFVKTRQLLENKLKESDYEMKTAFCGFIRQISAR